MMKEYEDEKKDNPIKETKTNNVSSKLLLSRIMKKEK